MKTIGKLKLKEEEPGLFSVEDDVEEVEPGLYSFDISSLITSNVTHVHALPTGEVRTTQVKPGLLQVDL